MTEETARIFPDPSVTRGRAAGEMHPLARLPEEWESIFAAWGERSFHAKQVFRWIHERGVFDPALMSDLKKGLRDKLAAGGMAEPGQVAHVHKSADGTRKLLLDLDRRAKVECVLIPMTQGSLDADSAVGNDEDDEGESPLPEPERPRKRVTLCISTQFGCAMGCVFCASGQSGLFRGLGAAEVVYQVIKSREFLAPDEDMRNLVFMGMGEPLHHYEETARALRLLTHPAGAGMSPRRITVSTVGLVPGIRKLGEDFSGKIGLAVSLHAPDDETRDRIMPMNRKYPIAELMAALRDYPIAPRRRITIEYTLIGGVNDSVEQADRLAKLLEPLKVKLNLIPMNPIEASELKCPDPTRVAAFRERMAAHGYSCFVRTRRGDDVSAACGQLALQTVAPERLVRR
jgi:23S rRNA (adenine2503-C2)-methyltransferase